MRRKQLRVRRLLSDYDLRFPDLYVESPWRVSRHTFRRTYSTLLQANREDVKVVQELLRHGSSKITLDVYAQAQMPAKREAQRKVVAMMRSEEVAQVLAMSA